MISCVRIDERLAHGQVCVRWVASAKATTLIVLDNATAREPFLKSVVIGVAPRGIHVEVCSEDDIPAIVERYNGDTGETAMIVTKEPWYVLHLVEAGASDIQTLNVGNMGASISRRKISSFAWASEKEERDFYSLSERGVRIETRQLPDDKSQDFIALLRK